MVTPPGRVAQLGEARAEKGRWSVGIAFSRKSLKRSAVARPGRFELPTLCLSA